MMQREQTVATSRHWSIVRLFIIGAVALTLFLVCERCGNALFPIDDIIISYGWQRGRIILVVLLSAAVVFEMVLGWHAVTRDVRARIVAVCAVITLLLVLSDPYTYGLSGHDAVVIRAWQKFAGAVQVLLLLVITGSALSGQFTRASMLLGCEVLLALAVNVIYVWRDGWLRFEGPWVSVLMSALVLAGSVALPIISILGVRRVPA